MCHKDQAHTLIKLDDDVREADAEDRRFSF